MRRLVLSAVAGAVLALCSTGQAMAWSWPAGGEVIRGYANGQDAYAAGQHRGVDIGGDAGEVVRAPAAGTVAFAGSVPTHGRVLTIETDDGFSVTLTHLGSVTVKKGAEVAEGVAVGLVGSSGVAEHARPYVHLGLRRTGAEHGYVDPLDYLPAREVSAAGAEAPAGPTGPSAEPSPATPAQPPVASTETQAASTAAPAASPTPAAAAGEGAPAAVSASDGAAISSGTDQPAGSSQAVGGTAQSAAVATSTAESPTGAAGSSAPPAQRAPSRSETAGSSGSNQPGLRSDGGTGQAVTQSLGDGPGADTRRPVAPRAAGSGSFGTGLQSATAAEEGGGSAPGRRGLPVAAANDPRLQAAPAAAGAGQPTPNAVRGASGGASPVASPIPGQGVPTWRATTLADPGWLAARLPLWLGLGVLAAFGVLVRRAVQATLAVTREEVEPEPR